MKTYIKNCDKTFWYFKNETTPLMSKKAALQAELQQYLWKYQCRMEKNEVRYVVWQKKWEKMYEEWIHARVQADLTFD